ncbi:MAG: hypothetical protein JO287_17825 [Pseudonocardiales bacterium]|nr:hypothetical protein [Pseudonocardiales bacterium]
MWDLRDYGGHCVEMAALDGSAGYVVVLGQIGYGYFVCGVAAEDEALR